MKCRACGTEIAEKALICFRCGASVQEAIHKPFVATRKKRPVILYVIIAVLVLATMVIAFLRFGTGV